MEEIYQTADFFSSLRTIAIVILVIYGLRFLGRLLAPWMAKQASSKIRRMAEEQMKKQGFNPNSQSQKPEGTVTVEKKASSSSSKNSKGNDDEYVDFEVID